MRNEEIDPYSTNLTTYEFETVLRSKHPLFERRKISNGHIVGPTLSQNGVLGDLGVMEEVTFLTYATNDQISYHAFLQDISAPYANRYKLHVIGVDEIWRKGVSRIEQFVSYVEAFGSEASLICHSDSCSEEDLIEDLITGNLSGKELNERFSDIIRFAAEELGQNLEDPDSVKVSVARHNEISRERIEKIFGLYEEAKSVLSRLGENYFGLVSHPTRFVKEEKAKEYTESEPEYEDLYYYSEPDIEGNLGGQDTWLYFFRKREPKERLI